VRCIYCLEEKPASAFSGREHVTPKAFGRFDTNNLVLRCVCDDCNNYFGREIDQKLARDSAEALDRVNVGIKSAKDFQSLGRRSTTYVQFQEGPLAGGKGYAVASRNGDNTLGVMAFPQVWFGKSEEGPFEKFLRDEVPTREELAAKGYEAGTRFNIKVFEIEDPLAFLESKGFNTTSAETGPITQPQGLVRIENVTRLAEPEFRAVTKIALNYVAAVVGYDIALASAFDDARNFARYGRVRARVRVHAYENPWFIGRRGHYVSLTRAAEMIVVQLSILLRIQYFVVLTSDAHVNVTGTAHFFDLSANRLVEIEPLAIRPGRPLKPTTTG
jgi:plasmid stabilization system protein ParE